MTRISLRLPKPLPRHLKDDQVTNLFTVIKDLRDRAMFMLMLRCGLRVQEVAQLTVDAIDYGRRQIFVSHGKGGKDRVVYLSEDARSTLQAYLTETILESKSLVPGTEGAGEREVLYRFEGSRRGSSTMPERAISASRVIGFDTPWPRSS